VARTPRRVWFHRARAVFWAALTLVALRWFPTSVVFVIIASGYANVISDWGAGEAADDSAVLERLDRIEALLNEHP
jgi:hypothetical protein